MFRTGDGTLDKVNNCKEKSQRRFFWGRTLSS